MPILWGKVFHTVRGALFMSLQVSARGQPFPRAIPALFIALTVTLGLCNSASAIGPLYYASAPYVAPPLGGGGTLIAGSQFFAARFQVTQPMTIDGIGGNIVGAPSGGSIFAALVALSSMSDYPDSTSL